MEHNDISSDEERRGSDNVVMLDTDVPVARIHRPAPGPQAIGTDRGRADDIDMTLRRPKQPDRSTQDRLRRMPTSSVLASNRLEVQASDIGMRPGMRADAMPIGDDSSHQSGIRFHLLTYDEEGRLHIELRQHIEDERRIARIWTVIEGERNSAPSRVEATSIASEISAAPDVTPSHHRPNVRDIRGAIANLVAG